MEKANLCKQHNLIYSIDGKNDQYSFPHRYGEFYAYYRAYNPWTGMSHRLRCPQNHQNCRAISSLNRLSPAPFQNGTDCRLLQLMQSHQRHSTRSWMPCRLNSGCVGSRLRRLHLSCVRYEVDYHPIADGRRFCRVSD